MPYISKGDAVFFEDLLVSLRVTECQATIEADMVAAAMNDAVKWREHQARVNAEQPKQSNSLLTNDARRWRKLIDMLGHTQDGSETSIRITLDDATRDYVITDLSTKKWWFGRSLAAAIDSVPEPEL